MNAEDLFNSLLVKFKDNIKSLTEISSGDDGKTFFISGEKFLCFDDIKFKEDDKAGKAPDLLSFHNGAFVFVEFKEGKVENVKKEDVKLKVIEGINVLFKHANQTYHLNKSDFSNFNFDYFVIHRSSRAERKSVGDALRVSVARWALSEYKGYYLRVAETISCHDKSFRLLSLLSQGRLINGKYIKSDRTEIDWTLA